MRIRMIITALMLMVSMGMNAQIRVGYQTDSAKIAEYRERIGIDMTVPDFETKKIDAKVMGTRLAGILEYLLENYTQGTYDRLLTRMLGEQVEELKQAYFNIKKMKFVSASKKDNEITILMKVWPDKNTRNVKQVDLTIHFNDGVSESQIANELFSYMSRYVQAREKMNQQNTAARQVYKKSLLGVESQRDSLIRKGSIRFRWPTL